jgi:hypothetical protein
MTKLTDANSIYYNGDPATAIYVNGVKVWPRPSPLSHWSAQGAILDPLEAAHLLCLPLTRNAAATKGPDFTEHGMLSYSGDGCLLDGATGYLSLVIPPEFYLAGNNWCFAWQDIPATAGNTELAYAGEVATFGLGAYVGTFNSAGWDVCSGLAMMSEQVPGTKYFRCMARKGNDVLFFENGVLMNTAALTGVTGFYFEDPAAGFTDLAIGALNGSQWYNGQVATVNFWNRLDDSFVPADLAAAFYNGGAGVDYIP